LDIFGRSQKFFSRLLLHRSFTGFFCKVLGIAGVVGLGFLANYINTDYGFFGVAIIALFYIFRNNKPLMAVSFAIAVVASFGNQIFTAIRAVYEYDRIDAFFFHLRAGDFDRTLILAACTIASIFFILLYNNKKGRDLKQLLYWFYPVHLLVIYGLYIVL